MSYQQDKLRKDLQKAASAALLGDCFREVDQKAKERQEKRDALLRLLQERYRLRRSVYQKKALTQIAVRNERKQK